MGVHILANENNAVFYCSTTLWAFGPLMPGYNIAEAFLRTFAGDDPRHYQDAELEHKWSEFQKLLTCPKGHQMTDVETYGDDTEFSCMKSGCREKWGLDGKPIVDPDSEEIDGEAQMEKAERLADDLRDRCA